MALDDEVIRLYTVELPEETPVELERPEKKSWLHHFRLDYNEKQNETYIAWIEGMKGLVTLQSAVWLFLRTFAPEAVYAGVLPSSPAWQTVLRKALSPLLWDGILQWSFMIILSGRLAAVSFLHKGTAEIMAGSIFRRPFRFIPAVLLAMSISAALNLTGQYDHIADFQRIVESDVTTKPFAYQNVLAWLNSMFNLFWFQDALQAGVLAHPAGQLWIITTCFLESYTIYMTMLLLPYMTRRWRIQLLLLFIAAAWWLNSWAWYAVTGLLICDNASAITALGQGAWRLDVNKLKVRFSVPYYCLPISLLALGIFLKYLYSDIRPDLADDELGIHTSTYLVGGLIQGYVDYSRPQMRVDNYFVVVGTILTVEMCPRLQKVLSWRPFQYLGHIALSAFLLQGCITYTVGISLFNKFVGDWEWNAFSACLAIFAVDFSLLWLCADLYARLVDYPGRKLASVIYHWYRN